MKTIIKENNGGGLQLEQYDQSGDIESVITGLEYTEPGTGARDIVAYLEDWGPADVAGNITSYTDNDNTAGDEDEDGYMIGARGVVDNHPTTKIIAEWDGKTLTLHVDDMGNAGRRYFGLN